jgi:hypothetical protein
MDHEVPAQGERTDWVSTDEDITWLDAAELPGEVLQKSAPLHYKAGSTADLQWFGPIERPRLTVQSDGGGGLPSRSGDLISASVPGWGDSGAEHMGSTSNGNIGVENTLKVYQGRTLLSEYPSDFIEVGGLSPERLPYRLVSENSRGFWTNPYSTTTRTEWGFNSAATATDAPPAVLPLIQLDYKVDTDTAGKARRNTDLTVIPSHLPGGPNSKAIGDAGLDVSYDDGATWHKAALKHNSDGWKTALHAPAKATYVTLRTSAHDSQGNSVTQTITRAFGLK